MLAKDISQFHLDNFGIVERVGSILSLLGTAFIAITFLGSRVFHKPINRLVFFASMGNIFTNVATLISRAAINTGHYNGFLCQFQASLIQMFMPADVFWTFAMALNVILTFYFQYGAEELRRLEKWYFVACYGFPSIPALIFLAIQTQAKGRMYGNATLWCWISNDWDVMRIACFYGPVWIVILATISIYIYAGKDIYLKRQALRNFNIPAPVPLPILVTPFDGGVKTMHVYVTSESAITSSDTLSPRTAEARKFGRTETYITAQGVETNPMDCAYPDPTFSGRERRGSTVSTAPITTATPARRYATMEANTAIWSYTKVAMLFFVAMMITWIPSSANRVYSVVHPHQVSLTLQYISAFVLPLQGFWNALIYAVTSLPACRAVWTSFKEGKRMSGGGIRALTAGIFGDSNHNRLRKFSEGQVKPGWPNTEYTMSEMPHSRPTTSSRPTTKATF